MVVRDEDVLRHGSGNNVILPISEREHQLVSALGRMVATVAREPERQIDLAAGNALVIGERCAFRHRDGHDLATVEDHQAAAP